jgi:hypothetical protein
MNGAVQGATSIDLRGRGGCVLGVGQGTRIIVVRCVFEACVASTAGGAIHVVESGVTYETGGISVYDSTFTGNRAGPTCGTTFFACNGGAIFADRNGLTRIERSVFSQNVVFGSDAFGGAV